MIAQDTLGTIYQNSTFTALARIVDWGNNLLTQAHTTSISCTVYREDTDGLTALTHFTNTVVDPTAAVYDTLQTSSTIWTKDTVGFNFKYTIDVTANPAFPTANLNYLVVFTVVPTTGQNIIFRYKINVV